MSEQPIQAIEDALVATVDALRPRCCHVTGEHNPLHFAIDPGRFCEMQKARAWERVIEVLGIEFDSAVSDEGCRWCKDSQT